VTASKTSISRAANGEVNELMLMMLGSPRRYCDGITRRETLTAGALSFLGGAFTLDNLLRVGEHRSAAPPAGKAKSVILLFLGGGAATQDMWDLKPDARAPFDLDTVDPQVRDRYGRTLFGESTLIARRLVEAGVRFVNVTWDGIERLYLDVNAWDTHDHGFATLKGNHLPGFDQSYSALLADLEPSGLLDETLVVVMSEMGRTAARQSTRSSSDNRLDGYA
jgi:hypothetical protein